MMYILILVLIIISFTIIAVFKKRKKKRRYKVVKPLSKMTKKEYREAMKDLEIK